MEVNGVEKTHQYLQELGLSDHEARIVSCLFVAPELTAKDISESTGISSKKIYGVLHALVEKSIIGSLETLPTIYKTEPHVVLNTLVEEHRKKFDELKREKETNLKVVENLRNKWVKRQEAFLSEASENLEVNHDNRRRTSSA